MALLMAIQGCGIDLSPTLTDAVASDAVTEVDPADGAIPDEVACTTDEDCAAYVGCCLDTRCRDGRCMPQYVDACCTIDGPCATSTRFHAGTCASTCVEGGCVEELSLPPGSCAAEVWTLDFAAEGLGVLALNDSDGTDRTTWAPAPDRPFGGRPSLHAGDVLCPTYFDGPLGPDCRPTTAGVESGTVTVGIVTPEIALPAESPSILQLWLWIDVGDGHVDGLEIEVTRRGYGPRSAWDSRTFAHAVGAAPGSAVLPRGAWTPVLIDLAPEAGQSVTVSLVFDTLDGRDNDHPGVYLGDLRIRTVCGDDLPCPAASPCAEPRAVAIAPFATTACVIAPADPGPACLPCATPATCIATDTCDRASCEGGACRVTHELTAECCTPDPTWPGDPSFEGALDEGWSVDAGWAVSAVQSFGGERALHFGTADGSALAPPGEAADGAIWTPTVTLPRDAPVWSFALLLATEWDAAPSADNTAGVDLLEAYVVPDAPLPVPPVVVWDSRAVLGTTDGAWRRVAIALDAWAGRSVRLGLRFRTGDEYANEGGVWIDDARVFRACPGCGPDLVSPGCDPGVGQP